MDNVYFTKNNWNLRLWVFENIPYKYFCQKNWLHKYDLAYENEVDFLIMSKNIGIIAGKMPECRQHEAISEEEWKARVGQILERCKRPGENYFCGCLSPFIDSADPGGIDYALNCVLDEGEDQ